MTDNDMLRVLIPLLRDGLAAAGVAVTVKQSYQPTHQGAEIGPALYLHKVGDVRRGAPSVSERWDAAAGAIIRTEVQVMETTWQVNALVPQDPADTAALTPADVVGAAAMVVASRAAVDAFSARSLGILRVTDIRNPILSDDRDRFAPSPSFDFTITHDRTLTCQVPAVATTAFRLARV